MPNFDENTLRIVRRNVLLGMWAAKKLGLVGESADAYSTDLGMRAFDCGDVATKIREDFNTAGVVESDEEIRRIMNESWLHASSGERTGDASDGAMVQIVRNLVLR
jgi:hypothetical protein